MASFQRRTASESSCRESPWRAGSFISSWTPASSAATASICACAHSMRALQAGCSTGASSSPQSGASQVASSRVVSSSPGQTLKLKMPLGV